MLGNYLTTALRLLWRERGYAAINIFGLAVAFACACWSSSSPPISSLLATFTRKRIGFFAYWDPNHG